MRKRNRHLNKSLREAACAFDARFVSGFSDGSSVDTWTDMSPNGRDATQATAANRPTYKTSILGGNPVMRFDGTNDVMTTAAFAMPTAVTAIMIAQSFTWTAPVTYYRALATHGNGPTPTETTGIALCYIIRDTAIDWIIGDLGAWGSGYQQTSNPRAIGPTTSGTNYRIVSTVLSSTLARMYVNGARTSTRKEVTGNCNSLTRSFTVGGSLITEPWNGDIAAVLYFPSNIGEPMRARIERSNALAFKIACS